MPEYNSPVRSPSLTKDIILVEVWHKHSVGCIITVSGLALWHLYAVTYSDKFSLGFHRAVFAGGVEGV